MSSQRPSSGSKKPPSDESVSSNRPPSASKTTKPPTDESVSSHRPPSASKATKPPTDESVSSKRPSSASKPAVIEATERISSASSRSRVARNTLSFEVNADQKAQDRIRAQSDDEREKFIIHVFVEALGASIRRNPKAFRGRFCKMADTPFNFYRGSAPLFYHDLKVDQDVWIARNNAAGSVFIHGDMHAENFGTYMDAHGILNFDVNDFDEGYFGPFTWDVKRLLASLYLVARAKGFSIDKIRRILKTCVSEYLQQVYRFCNSPEDKFALTLETATGKIRQLLNETRIQSHVQRLNDMTVIESYDRIFIRPKYADIDDKLRQDIECAFKTNYLESIPQAKKITEGPIGRSIAYNIKDIIQCSSSGIGSAGIISYMILLEGPTQALENDIVLFMKEAQVSAVSLVVKNPEIEKYFQHDGIQHDGLRTVLCSYAMQASTPKWLGYMTLGTVPYLVDEVSAHTKGLSWSDVNTLDDVLEVVKYLGQVAAKVHCVADSDCINTPKEVPALPFSIIPSNTEDTIRKAIDGQDEEFINDMVDFGMAYGEQVRRDHAIFKKAFEDNRIPGLEQE